MNNFDKSFDFLLGIEGKFSNHQDDGGGATMLGITRDDLSLWRKRPVTIDEVRELSVDEAKAIYMCNYWQPMKLGGFKDLTALVLFDQGVNRGIHQVAHELQNILGVKKDGIIGLQTIHAAEAVDDKELAYKLLKVAQIYYANIVTKRPSQIVFLKGWLNRTHRLLDLLFI